MQLVKDGLELVVADVSAPEHVGNGKLTHGLYDMLPLAFISMHIIRQFTL